MKLKPEITKEEMQAWVAALRSGDYKQGRLQLRNGCGELCCLGVLYYGVMGETVGGPHVGKNCVAYQKINRKIGQHLVSRLVDLNDAQSRNFADIADYLETVEL